MNKRLQDIILEITLEKKERWIDLARECGLNINKFEKALQGQIRLDKSELYNIYKYSDYTISYNSLLQIFGYYADNNIITRGEIYWVNFGDSKGSIQSGLRPALIVSNNLNNRFSTTVNIAPITSSISKKSIPSHVIIEGCELQKASTVLVEQIKTINKDELGEFIGSCDKKIIEKINCAMNVQFNINNEEEFNNKENIKKFAEHLVKNYKGKDPDRFKKALLNQIASFNMAELGV